MPHLLSYYKIPPGPYNVDRFIHDDDGRIRGKTCIYNYGKSNLALIFFLYLKRSKVSFVLHRNLSTAPRRTWTELLDRRWMDVGWLMDQPAL